MKFPETRSVTVEEGGKLARQEVKIVIEDGDAMEMRYE